MARWYRSGRYYGRNRGYRRNNYYRYNNNRNRSYGNMRAAKQQADQATVTINIPTSISCFSQKQTMTFEGVSQELITGVRPINIYDLLNKSEFYRNYANMYDEFKVDKIKVKLLPTSWTITNDTSYKNVTVYTAWDRSGLSKEQVLIQANNITPTSTSFGTAGNTDGIYCIVGEDITTYSSSESRTINPNTNTSIVRWLNPKTMAEKSQWLSTGLLKEWYKKYDDAHGRFYDITTGRVAVDSETNTSTGETYAAEVSEITGPWVADSTHTPGTSQLSGATTLRSVSAVNKENPCYLIEDSGFQFKPTLLVGTYPPVESNVTPNVVHFNIEAEIVCSFRGLRKAKIVS